MAQVSELQPLGKKHKGNLSDGSDSIGAIFASSVNSMLESKQISNGCVLRITSFVCNDVQGTHKLICTECEVESAGEASTSKAVKEEPEEATRASPSKENMSSNLKANNRQQDSPALSKKIKIEGSDSHTPQIAKRESDSMKTPAHPRIASLAGSSRTPQPSPSEQ